MSKGKSKESVPVMVATFGEWGLWDLRHCCRDYDNRLLLHKLGGEVFTPLSEAVESRIIQDEEGAFVVGKESALMRWLELMEATFDE